MNAPLPLDPSINQLTSPKPTEKNLLKDLLILALRNWYWFVLSLVVCMAVGKIYLRYMVPVYNIQSRLLVKQNNQGSAGGSDPMSQINLDNSNNDVVNAIEILKTRLLMRRTVRELNLNISYFMKGLVKSTELYRTAPFIFQLTSPADSLLSGAWGVTVIPDGSGVVLETENAKTQLHWGDTLKLGDMSIAVMKRFTPFGNQLNTQYLVTVAPEEQIVSSYLSRVKISQAGDGENIITMSTTDAIPKRGEDVLDKLYDVYTRANVEDQNSIADNTIEFINSRLEIVHKELSGVEKNIEDFKTTNKLTSVEEQSKQLLTSTKEVNDDIGKQDLQLELLSAVESRLKEKTARVVPPDLLASDPTYQQMSQRFNALVLQRDAALGTTKPGNPIIQQMNAQIDTVKTEMLLSLENARKGIELARGDLQTKLNQLSDEFKSTPAKEHTFLDISREQTVKQQLYLFLLQKREETAISKSGTLSNSRLIEPAKADMTPISPNYMNSYLVSLLFGLAIPSLIIYLREFLNNNIRARRDIEENTTVPILGEIGHNKSESPMVALADPRSHLAEQFRTIRTNLKFVLAGKKHNVILITSSMSGEGKSFISLNLAGSIALSGKKVVILELDLRKPRLSSHLGLTNEHGFTNYMISNTDLKYLPKPVPDNPNLYVIGSGPIPPNPAELLMQDKIGVMFDYLYSNFDYIIIDSPPVGLVSDALLVEGYADACIYVTREGYTLKQQLNIVNDLAANKKMKGISIIINDVDMKSKGGYGYGYGYAYGQNAYYDGDPNKAGNRLRKAKRNV
jgi:capsular exopolysaccharide synthesis family protein